MTKFADLQNLRSGAPKLQQKKGFAKICRKIRGPLQRFCDKLTRRQSRRLFEATGMHNNMRKALGGGRDGISGRL
ncbi:hypothetical protein [uncultured Ruegeria sp.]|uniref:hypothetical protein n=1 Tax=uncultured Ruegeria sp. TaxID=259304 RepID=UPI00260499C9|nr:hypothetical protein [uncultured Ruegeria sp.]